MFSLDSLPDEILNEIFSYLMMNESIRTIISLIHTCSTFRSLFHGQNFILWSNFTFNFTHDFYRINSPNRFISQWKAYINPSSAKDLIVNDGSEIKIARKCYEKFVDFLNILVGDGFAQELVRKIRFDNSIRFDGEEFGWLQERLVRDFPNLTGLYVLGEGNMFMNNSSTFPHLKYLEIPSAKFSDFAMDHFPTLEYLTTGQNFPILDSKRLNPKVFFYRVLDKCYVESQEELDLILTASNIFIPNVQVQLKDCTCCNTLQSLTIRKPTLDLSDINFPNLTELNLEKVVDLKANNLQLPSLKSLSIDVESGDFSFLYNLPCHLITDIHVKGRNITCDELSIIEDNWPSLKNITLIVEFNVLIQLRNIKYLFISRSRSISVVSDTIEKCTIFSSCSMQSTIRRIDYLEIHSLEQVIINDIKLEVGKIRLLNYNLVLYKEKINKKLLYNKISKVDEIICEYDDGEYTYLNDLDFNYLEGNNSHFLTKMKLKGQKGVGFKNCTKLVEIAGYSKEIEFDSAINNNISIFLDQLIIPKMKEIPLFRSVTVLKLTNSKIEDLVLASLPNLKIFEIGRSQHINSITISSIRHNSIEYIHIFEVFWLHIRAFLNTPNLKEFLIWKCDFMDGSEVHYLNTPNLLLNHCEM